MPLLTMLSITGVAAARAEASWMSSEPQAHVANAQIEPSALVELLASDYDLAAPLACEFLRRGFNDHYLVTASDERSADYHKAHRHSC